jgi:hypothetical protein
MLVYKLDSVRNGRVGIGSGKAEGAGPSQAIGAFSSEG